MLYSTYLFYDRKTSKVYLKRIFQKYSYYLIILGDQKVLGLV